MASSEIGETDILRNDEAKLPVQRDADENLVGSGTGDN
jgi:hypothetical protein